MVDITKYESIVRMYTQPLYKYCYCRLHCDKSLTDETVNDVMRILFEKWDKLETDENIKAWLYRVADNCIKHNLREHARYYSHNESLEEKVENKKFDDIQRSDEYFSDDTNEEACMERILNSLPDEYKEIFRLRFIEKKTISETAKLVGIPYTSLYLRLTKIEAMVRKEIKKIFH